MRDFRSAIERIADESPLPEYSLRLVCTRQHELVTLYRDYAKPGRTARSTEQIVPPAEMRPARRPPSPPLLSTPPTVIRNLEAYYRQEIDRGDEPEFLIIRGNGELVDKVLRLLREDRKTPTAPPEE